MAGGGRFAARAVAEGGTTVTGMMRDAGSGMGDGAGEILIGFDMSSGDESDVGMKPYYYC